MVRRRKSTQNTIFRECGRKEKKKIIILEKQRLGTIYRRIDVITGRRDADVEPAANDASRLDNYSDTEPNLAPRARATCLYTRKTALNRSKPLNWQAGGLPRRGGAGVGGVSHHLFIQLSVCRSVSLSCLFLQL